MEYAYTVGSRHRYSAFARPSVAYDVVPSVYPDGRLPSLTAVSRSPDVWPAGNGRSAGQRRHVVGGLTDFTSHPRNTSDAHPPGEVGRVGTSVKVRVTPGTRGA
jgi:hypothetical protein